MNKRGIFKIPRNQGIRKEDTELLKCFVQCNVLSSQKWLIPQKLWLIPGSGG